MRLNVIIGISLLLSSTASWANTLHLIMGHSICGIPGEGEITTTNPKDLKRGQFFLPGKVESVQFDQVENLLPIAKGFFDQKLKDHLPEIVYVMTACVPGFQFAPLWAYPGQGAGTWHPSGPSLPAILDQLYGVLKANPDIDSMNLYVLNGFNDAVFALITGQTELTYLEQSFIEIHESISKVALYSKIKKPVRLAVEKPLSFYDEQYVQPWVDKMIVISDHLQETYGAASVGIGPLPFQDFIHPTHEGVQTIGEAFAVQARIWQKKAGY